MVEEEVKENLYVSDEPTTIDVNDVDVVIEEMTGMEYSKIADEMGLEPGNESAFDNAEFMKRLIEECVIEPEDLDPSKLRIDAMVKITTEIQQGMNVEEEVENLSQG